MADTPVTPFAGHDTLGFNPHTGQPVTSEPEYGMLLGDPSGRTLNLSILRWKTRRVIEVSTVHLVTDMSFGECPAPECWETMLFGDTWHLPLPMGIVDFGDIQARYNSQAKAKIGHEAWCRLVTGWLCYAGRHTVTRHDVIDQVLGHE